MVLAVEEHVEVVILAPFLLLTVGALLRQTTKSLPIPYTLQLLIVGIVLGFLLRNSEWDDALQKSVSRLGEMDPHLLLHVFLPPLVFESAASLEWNLFTRSKFHIIFLAGPGLLLASTLTAIALFNILSYSNRFNDDLLASECPPDAWSFPTALLLGVIMSATDPVAVVALLKELGCKASLATTIEGESLLNDGTALVMYTILIKLTAGDTSDNVWDYLFTFVKMSIGGALFGIAFAAIVVQWLRMVFNDSLTEITITLCAAYLCFFIAEYFLHVSGVLAVVCLGLYFGQIGRTSVSPEVAHFLEEFWQILGYIGNTLIFVVAGTVIGFKLPAFPASEFGQMVVMYIICTAVRALVFLLSFLIFKTFGYDLEIRDQIVATWAGLRGAVGLSLAMMVFNDSKICEPVRDVVMYYSAGIVILTVSINSITMPYVVSYLGLDTVHPTKEIIYEQALKQLTNSGKKQEANLRADHLFDSTIWDEARKYYVRVDKEKRVKVQEESDKAGQSLAEKELRRRALMITKRSYWKQFQDGLLSHGSLQYLIHHTDFALDNHCSMDEWEETYGKLIRLNSSLDKGTDRLVASASSSISEKRKVKVLNVLDSIPVILMILLLVIASCILPFTVDPNSTAFFVIENTTTAIFTFELSVRLYCLHNWNPCAVDPYIAIDIVAVLLDIVLLSVSDFLGGFSEYSKSIRTIRFLRLFRLLRFARFAHRLNKAKIAALNEPTTLLEAEGWMKWFQRRALFNQLKSGYEIASGFKVAREEVLLAMKHIQNDGNDLRGILECVERDLKNVHSALLDVQRLYSEIAASITTTLAARIVLNKQRLAIVDLHREGLLDLNEHNRLKASVEYQMKKLSYHPPIIAMPQKIDILGQIPWLECVDRKELGKIASSFEDAVFQRGDILVQQDEKSDIVFVLARGTVVVSYKQDDGNEVEIDELGMGSVFGEIAWALNSIRGATIRATSPGLLFTILGSKLRELAYSNDELERRLWKTCGRRLSENVLATQTVGCKSREQLRDMVNEMELFSIDPVNKKLQFFDLGKIVLLRGTAIVDIGAVSQLIEAPQLIPAHTKGDDITFKVEFSTDAKIMCNKFVFEGKHENQMALFDTLQSEDDVMDKRIYLAEHEIKTPKSISTIQPLGNTLASELKSASSLELTSATDDATTKNTDIRRSTIVGIAGNAVISEAI